MAVTGTASASLSFSNLSTSDLEQAAIQMALSCSVTFSDGSGAGQVLKIWQDTRPLTDGGNETLDFNPTPTSGVTGVVSFVAIKAIMIKAADLNSTSITPTGTLLLRPMGIFKPSGFYSFIDPSAAGSVVTPTTTDTLIMTNSAGAVASYTILVAGL